MKPKGTPKTLECAIENGLQEIIAKNGLLEIVDDSTKDRVATLSRHVVDFMAQAFNAAMLNIEITDQEAIRLELLFNKISGRK